MRCDGPREPPGLVSPQLSRRPAPACVARASLTRQPPRDDHAGDAAAEVRLPGDPAVRDEARDQHRTPDHADDDPDSRSPRCCGRRSRVRAGRSRSRRRHRWRRSCRRSRPSEISQVPSPPITMMKPVTSASRLAPCSAMIAPRNRNGTVLSSQVLEARVDERRGQDPPEARDVAGVDAVTVEAVRVERVDRLDSHMNSDDPGE